MAMSYYIDDPDEWETVIATGPYWASVGRQRRAPEEVARIKAEKRAAHEEAVLAEADAIRARRAASLTAPYGDLP